MKRKGWILFGGGMIVLAIAVILIVQVLKPTFSTASELTEKEARVVAEQRYSGTVTDIRQNEEQFVIELERETGKYELQINAKTGEVSSLKRIEQKDDSQGTVGESPETEVLDKEKIKEIALKHATGEIKSLEQMKEGEKTVYQVTVQDKNSKTTFSIDAHTGEILKKETNPIKEKPKRITEEEAISLALQQVPGMVDDIDTETINGIVYFLIEIESNDGREATVEINAITGDINSLTWDDQEDDDD
jgi:uncharacterized membrane protein YkoI